MGNFIKRLGKFVQGLLDKIRGKKEHEREIASSCIELESGLKWIPLDEPIVFTCENAQFDKDLLEKFFNTSRTNLPKCYWVKTLILTLAANQDSEYQMVDMSQYEERGLAHYVVGSTKTPEELARQFEAETGERLTEEDEGLWVDDMCSAIVGEAVLWYYEDLGIWDVEYESE